MEQIKVAGVQMMPQFKEIDANVERVCDTIRELAAQDTQLAVFPECALNGYCFDSKQEAMPYAVAADSPEIETLIQVCREAKMTVVVGFLEKEGGHLYNSAALISEGELIAVYRKTHLPCLGVDRFVTPGDKLEIYDTPLGRIGMLICYDLRFPEASRTLGLKGADILCLPTNWPEGAESAADFIAATRAYENRFFVMAVNRVGIENNTAFIGRSKIVDNNGQIITSAEHRDETILYAEIDPKKAREKAIIRIPGAYEMNPVEDRRPELYDILMQTQTVSSKR